MSHGVEIVYDRDCPNVAAARTVLRHALREVGAEERWREWERQSPSTPEHLRGYGSPTILVDGRDVAETPTETPGGSCRLYDDGTGSLSGVPPLELIVQAISAARHRSG